MRSYDEIIQRLHRVRAQDVFGFEAGVLLAYLPFEKAKPFLDETKFTPGIEKVWDADVEPLTVEHITTALRTYMAFALDKAANHRGLSANRSISKLKSMLWLLGDTELLDKIDRKEIEYKNYGVPILLAICAKYTIVFPDTPALMRMAEGRACRDGCYEGCNQ